jgi:hypothetical protein
LRDKIQKELKAIAIEVGEFEEEMCSRFEFHNALQIGRLQLPLHLSNRFHLFGGDFTSTDSLQAQPGFVAHKKADVATPTHHT